MNIKRLNCKSFTKYSLRHSAICSVEDWIFRENEHKLQERPKCEISDGSETTVKNLLAKPALKNRLSSELQTKNIIVTITKQRQTIQPVNVFSTTYSRDASLEYRNL